jgi:renalase
VADRIKPIRVAIVGAGMTGITCAVLLRDLGNEVTVFEKSRGIGGRLATRRVGEGLSFDHGAPCFYIHSQTFRAFLKEESPESILPWTPTINASGQNAGQSVVSKPGMNGFLKHAARGLDMRLSREVVSISDHAQGWHVSTGESSEGEAWDIVVVTAPAPQATRLLSFSKRLRSELLAIRMAPCWALMLAFSSRARTPFDVVMPCADDLVWIGRNSSKPERDRRFDTWVAHASAEWSQTHLECEADQVLALLQEQVLAEIDQSDSATVFASAHRWRYAKTEKALGVPFLSDETGRVFFAGDGCLGPSVEAAFESGVRLARYIAGHAEG